MSIYIHDMDMPKGKPICIIIDTVGQVRRYDLNNDKYIDDELFEAVPVPPHGRCIDVDSKTFPTPHRNPSNDYMKGWNTCLRSVQQQPTIIPAETIFENEIKIIDTKGKPNYNPKHRFVIPAEEGET